YASCHCNRHYGLDHLRASRARHRLGQIREMESAQPARARPCSNGSGTPGKNAQPDESAAGNGSAAGIDAAIQYFLNLLLALVRQLHRLPTPAGRAATLKSYLNRI